MYIEGNDIDALTEDLHRLERERDELEESNARKTEEIRRLHGVCRELEEEIRRLQAGTVEEEEIKGGMSLKQYALIILSEAQETAIGDAKEVLSSARIVEECFSDENAAAYAEAEFIAYPVREADGRIGIWCNMVKKTPCTDKITMILHLTTAYRGSMALPAVGALCAVLMYCEDKLRQQGWRKKDIHDRPDPVKEALDNLYQFWEGDDE